MDDAGQHGTWSARQLLFYRQDSLAVGTTDVNLAALHTRCIFTYHHEADLICGSGPTGRTVTNCRCHMAFV